MEKSDQVAAAAAEGSGAAHELWNLGDGRVAVDCGIAEVEGDFRMAVSRPSAMHGRAAPLLLHDAAPCCCGCMMQHFCCCS